MASQTPKDTLPIAAVFSNLFRNLPRLILTNLIFAVPLGAFFALFWWITVLFGVSSDYAVLVQLLMVIPVFPFYAGVVKITAKMVATDEKVPVFSTFFGAVKENFWRFLVHGAVFYAAVVFSYVSLSLYIRLLSQSMLFVGPLIISVIVILFFTFMFFYIPSMTVTFDIPMKYIYKNSLLMSYGELKKNFIALLGLFLLFVLSTTFLIACYGSPVAVVIVTILLAAVLVPSVASFIINSAIFERMYQMITDKSERSQAIDAKIKETKTGVKQADKDEMKEALKNFEIDDSVPDDEYIYFNGRMMKKSVIIKLKQESEEV